MAQAGENGEAIVQHLSAVVGSEVRITLEVDARIAEGLSDALQRTLSENCRTLHIKDFGFERS